MTIKKKRPRNERTSKRVAAIAARILRGGGYRERDVLLLAASCLTQSPDRRK
jgi:hypothetical protein